MVFSKPVRRILRRPYRVLSQAWHSPELKGSMWERSQSYWDHYARTWSPEDVAVDDSRITDDNKSSALQYLGDEWGQKEDVDRVVAEYITPYISLDTVAGEIGSGGGRITGRVAGLVKELHCFDISAEMLKRARAATAVHPNVHFHLLTKPRLGGSFKEKFDFFYSFDVFVHVDIIQVWKYFEEIHAALKPGGRAFLHTTNLAAPGGWQNFRSQKGGHPNDHHFISPEIVDIFAARSNFRIIKRSEADSTNFYLNRDYLFVLEKA
ncbi:MAG: class I SAM-dependent methyltransferase [Bryobacteraceae bacterium]